MFNLCFPFIPSLFYIVLNDDSMLCKVTFGVLKGASKLNLLLLLLLSLADHQKIHYNEGNHIYLIQNFLGMDLQLCLCFT